MKIIILFILTVFLSINSFAQESKANWRVSVGLGLGIKKNLRQNNTYKSGDKKFIARPLPIVMGHVGRFSLGHQGLSFLAFGSRPVGLSLFINRQGDRYESLGMTARKESFFAGISGHFLKYHMRASKDINGYSKGSQLHFSYTEMTPINETISLRSSLSLDWYDDRYANYYYGVRASESTSTRAQYTVHNYFQPGIGFMPTYKFNESLSLMSGLNFKFVPKKVRQSPTMNGNSIESGIFFGLTYTF